MCAGSFVIRDDIGGIVVRGKRIEGRCAVCPAKIKYQAEDGTWKTRRNSKNLTNFYCLCKRSPILDALHLARTNGQRLRGEVFWICLRCIRALGPEASCLATHLGLGATLKEIEPVEA